jgi:hypothetical protein
MFAAKTYQVLDKKEALLSSDSKASLCNEVSHPLRGATLFVALLSQYVEICILHAIIIRWEYYNYLWKELALYD